MYWHFTVVQFLSSQWVAWLQQYQDRVDQDYKNSGEPDVEVCSNQDTPKAQTVNAIADPI
jgi:hypothetical protein